jgi:hypothetical protein
MTTSTITTQTNESIQLSKEYISNFIQDLELIFIGREMERLKNVRYPFYDGGLTPIIMYYTRKYKIPIKFPSFLENIKGNTLFEICSNFYPYSYDRLNLKSENDLFREEFLKNYYFNNLYYDIKIVMNSFKNNYDNKNMNSGDFTWVSNLPNLLLSIMALKEKPSIGIKINTVKNDPSSNSNSQGQGQDTTSIINSYYDYVKELTEKYLINSFSKKTINYIKVFCLYQMMEPNSPVIEKEGSLLVNYLLKSRKLKNLWTINRASYIDNWLMYGLIKDYFTQHFNYFISQYSLKDISLIYIEEGFANPKKKSKNKSKKVSKSDKKLKKTKESFEDTKSISWWKVCLMWIGLPIFFYLGIRIIMFFWSRFFNLIGQ